MTNCFIPWRSKALVSFILVLSIVSVIGCAQATPTATPTQAAKATPAKEAKPEAVATKPAAQAPTPQAKEAKPQKEAAKDAKKAAKIRVAYAAVAGTQTPIWLAKEKGLYEKYGLDAEVVYIASGAPTAQAMIAGEIQVGSTGGESVVTSNLAGSDIVMIAATSNYLAFSLFGQPNIQRVEELKGKTLGISRFGSGPDTAARMTLKRLGLEPGKDVAIIESGGSPETFGAMKAGGIHATVTGPPNSVALKKLGMRELVNISELEIPYVQTGIAVSKQFMANNRETVMSFLKAYVEAISVAKKDKDYTMKIIGQYSKTDDKEVLDDTYEFYMAKLAPKVPYVGVASVQTLLDEAAKSVPKAKDAKPESFFDNQLMKELDDSGFIKKLYE
ncbi:MAG: ABC transporter substrate-binding protein [Chloroflexi bacterium]|nr:ABC transporter substrate-binding protein [Chloroflexota bacterium]